MSATVMCITIQIQFRIRSDLHSNRNPDPGSDVDPDPISNLDPYSIASLDPNPKLNTDSGFGSKGTKIIIFKSEPKPKNVILALSILHVQCILSKNC